MARLLIKALELAGHHVRLESEFRSYLGEPDASRLAALRAEAAAEAERIAARWAVEGTPDLWFCYHSYYKSPDLLGPRLAARFGTPMVTVESSYAAKREGGPWGEMQHAAMEIVRRAALNLCMTARDRDGLARIVPAERLAALFPFIDTSRFKSPTAQPSSRRIVTVAMMRPGDKLSSYTLLAEALRRIAERDWTLRIVGDGPARDAVQALFSWAEADRIDWTGEVGADAVPRLLDGALFAWPGLGEAYGLAYLEAQAAGLPVVAQSIAGVPEVVRNGETGVLTPAGDVAAYAAALAEMLEADERRRAMGLAARRFVLAERSLDAAAARLKSTLASLVEPVQS
jgi:glycosyltransferase involved in cell wall biosynthesis